MVDKKVPLEIVASNILTNISKSLSLGILQIVLVRQLRLVSHAVEVGMSSPVKIFLLFVSLIDQPVVQQFLKLTPELHHQLFVECFQSCSF